MSAAYKIPQLAVVLLAGLLASCASRPVRPPPSPAPAPAPAPIEKPAGREFRVDGASSLLTIQVYKGGPLSRAGHNHVIASHTLRGVAYVPDDPTRAGFDVHMRVDELVVDEDELRREAGPDFPPGVPEAARLATKRNMLSEALLDAERYPDIVLQSEAMQRGPDGLEAQVRVVVRDRAASVIVPLQYELRGDELDVQGAIALKQTDLGLTPYSLFGGALRVEDEIKVRFRIVARAVDAAAVPDASSPPR
ncbi:MAG TPA: YceI family protein [Steroidobacteraceae bacterium]|nr:YceI family protein [Steroidobacteraceae bacterium]